MWIILLAIVLLVVAFGYFNQPVRRPSSTDYVYTDPALLAPKISQNPPGELAVLPETSIYNGVLSVNVDFMAPKSSYKSLGPKTNLAIRTGPGNSRVQLLWDVGINPDNPTFSGKGFYLLDPNTTSHLPLVTPNSTFSAQLLPYTN